MRLHLIRCEFCFQIHEKPYVDDDNFLPVTAYYNVL